MADFWSDLGDGVAAVAPTIARAFGGPLAGLGVTWLEKALGVDPGASKDAKSFKDTLTSALANPDQVIKIREQDYAFKQFCMDHELQIEKVEAADRDSARRRQVDLHDLFPNKLAVAIFGAFTLTILLQFGLIVMSAMYKFTLMPEAYRMLDSTTGALGSLAGLVAMFYFGSNRQSKAKDDTISALTKPS